MPSKILTLDELAEDVTNYLYDREWCRENGINYSNPDISKVYELRKDYYISRGYKIQYEK